MSSDREKLIELQKQATILYLDCLESTDQKGLTDTEGRAKFIADYLLANGVTVSPMPIGSTVYEIRARGKRQTLCGMRKCDYAIVNNLYIKNAIAHGFEFYVQAKKFVKYDKTRWNKTIFATKEEAEQALKERSVDNA